MIPPRARERDAHLMCGVSMAGGGAFHKAFRSRGGSGAFPDSAPPVNLRWESCRGRYMDKFDPSCWGWKTNYQRPLDVVGRFYGVFTVRQGQFTRTLYGMFNPNTVALVSKDNPIEMLDAYDIKDGQLEMYIAYGGRDQFNIDAQVESFLYRGRQKGITGEAAYDPRGKNSRPPALKFLPAMLDGLQPLT